MDDEYDRVSRAVDTITAAVPVVPEVAIVLGSGLGDAVPGLEEATVIPYSDIAGWPVPGVLGHAGRLVIGRLGGRPAAMLLGRVHYYEGHDMRAVAFATRVVARLGARVLVLTNAAGGIDPTFARGALMLIEDHINLIGDNPLIGSNDERHGVRFPDMSEVYSSRLRRLADSVAESRGLALEHGVYAAVHGPSFETPAEIRYLRTIGADAVGMSTVPEAIVARHMGVEVLGISCITNMAAGILPQPLSHAEVIETTAQVRDRFTSLLEGVVRAL